MFMKKITLIAIAGLVAIVAQAGVTNQDKAAKLNAVKASTTLMAEDVTVTPPADAEQLIYNFQGYDTYINQDKTAQVFVVIEGNDIYIKGLSIDYYPDGWVKGSIDEGTMVATFPQAYMGQFSFWGDNYDLYFDGAEFTVNEDMSVFTSADGYTTTADETVLDEYNNVTLTRVEPTPAVPATPTITEFTQGSYGYYVKITIPTTDVDGNDLFPALLSYQILFDKSGTQGVYEFTTDDYIFIEENMTQIPYNYTDSYDIDKAGRQVYLYGNFKQWNAVGVKSIYTVGDVTNESEIFWLPIEVTGIDAISTATVTETAYYDLQGRRASDSTRGILIKMTRKSDGTTTVEKVMR